jgi:alanine racemase
MRQINSLAWLEISRPALQHNLRLLRGLAGKKVIIAPAVKANAYGHGLSGAAKAFLQGEADWLFVNSLEEARQLRRNKINRPILLIGRWDKKQIAEILTLRLRFFLDDYALAKAVSTIAASKKQPAVIHLKIDTGMSRQGLKIPQEIDLIEKISKLPYLDIEGIATHFATADGPRSNPSFKKQLALFEKVALAVEKRLGKKLIKHCANSAAAMLYPQCRFDLIRPGIAAYGLYPSRTVKKIWEKNHRPLQPALSFKTRITLIKTINKGDAVSYGGTFVAKNKMTIALLPVGYYDGLDRKLSNCGGVLIGGQRAKILGRVCMDLTVADISKIKNAQLGDEVVIIGSQGKATVTADELADKIGTINYEVVTRLRESLPRYYID